jgi:hypothetical protein
MSLPKSSTVWTSFLDVFDKAFWVIVIFCALCLSIVCYITWISIENEPPNNRFSTSIALVLLSHIGLSLSMSPKKVSTRISVLTVCTTGMVLFWVYNSGLTSFLTVEKVDLPIKTLEVKLHLITFF